MSSSSPPAFETTPANDAEMAKIAALNARMFRTMLRVSSRGLHLADAVMLLKHRAATGLELIADDVNTVLTNCVFASEGDTVQAIVAALKAENRLGSIGDEGLLADALVRLQRHDVGPIVHLQDEAFKRSPAAHDPAARAAAGVFSGKRKRAEDAPPSSAAAQEEGADNAAASLPDEESSSSSSSTGAQLPGGAALTSSGSSSSSDSQHPGPPPASSAAARTPEACYKHALQLLRGRFTEPPGQFAGPRWAAAQRVLDYAEGELKIAPNARSFVLLLFAAVEAREHAAARSTLRSMLDRKLATLDSLYLYLQPAFLARLVEEKVVDASIEELLRAEPHSDKWCFLTAARAAARGNQFGSKHGAVLTKNSECVAVGHNHRFAPKGHSHIRVMHSEVHALVKLQNPEVDAVGMHCWIVELDARGVGYELATPCAMCQSGLCRCGVAMAHFSSHEGVKSTPVSHRPHLVCESLAMAKQRTYPKSTADPDAEDAAGVGTAGAASLLFFLPGSVPRGSPSSAAAASTAAAAAEPPPAPMAAVQALSSELSSTGSSAVAHCGIELEK